jgi:hypothetical protein
MPTKCKFLSFEAILMLKGEMKTVIQGLGSGDQQSFKPLSAVTWTNNLTLSSLPVKQIE